jgi:hypothetical protein
MSLNISVRGHCDARCVFLADANPTIWATALIATGSALVGALIGAYGSYKANLALDERRRQARAAIRRKSKVYTPLRHELISLKEAVQQGQHIIYGIAREQPDLGSSTNSPPLILWDQLKADGRGKTAASRVVRARLEDVDDAADECNRARLEEMDLFDPIGRKIFKEIRGEDLTLVNSWVHGTTLLAILENRSDSTEWSIQLYINEKEHEAEFLSAFRSEIYKRPEVRLARERFADLNTRLLASIDNAVRDLETGMELIARDYERETVDD